MMCFESVSPENDYFDLPLLISVNCSYNMVALRIRCTACFPENSSQSTESEGQEGWRRDYKTRK
jgi:hypothetical protein